MKGQDKNVSPAFLIDTEAATHERVLKTIERFTLAGDFRVTDVTNQTAQLSVKGVKRLTWCVRRSVIKPRTCYQTSQSK